MPDRSDEPLLEHDQLIAYVATIDAAEKAATGDHFGAMLTLGMALDSLPQETMAAVLGWMSGHLQAYAEAAEITIPELAAQLRASGAR